MYGLTYVKNLDGKAAPTMTSFLMTNATTVTKGDPVNLVNGYLAVATASAKILGVAAETVVNAGAVGAASCKVIVDPMAVYIADNDNDSATFAAADIGNYFDITGTTGAVLVDTNTKASTGSLIAIEYNPQIAPYESDTSIGLFMIAESQLFGRYA